jgi:hypothetical protein
MFAIPTAALAAGGAFSNNSATVAAVQATNSNAKGTGIEGTGKKYGVFSNGPLGVASGKSLSCTGCVGSGALSTDARNLSNAYTSTGQVTLSDQDESEVTSVHVAAGNYVVNWSGEFYASASGGTVDCYLYVRPGGDAVDLLETILVGRPTLVRGTAASIDAIKKIPTGTVSMHCFTSVNGATAVGRLTLERVGTITP